MQRENTTSWTVFSSSFVSSPQHLWHVCFSFQHVFVFLLCGVTQARSPPYLLASPSPTTIFQNRCAFFADPRLLQILYSAIFSPLQAPGRPARRPCWAETHRKTFVGFSVDALLRRCREDLPTRSERTADSWQNFSKPQNEPQAYHVLQCVRGWCRQFLLCGHLSTLWYRHKLSHIPQSFLLRPNMPRPWRSIKPTSQHIVWNGLHNSFRLCAAASVAHLYCWED